MHIRGKSSTFFVSTLTATLNLNLEIIDSCLLLWNIRFPIEIPEKAAVSDCKERRNHRPAGIKVKKK